MTDELVQFGGSPHRLQGWLLFLLEEMTRLGLSPVSQERLHLLLFFSAVLTPVHGLDQPVPKILKYKDRPFYPEGQDALVRLVVSGLVKASVRKSLRDDGWDGDGYAITADGVSMSARLTKARWGAGTALFVRDLVGSFAELDPADADAIIAEDPLFGDAAFKRNDIRDIRKDNAAYSTARMIADYDVDGVRPGRRDSLALYFDYLQAKRAA